MYSNYGGVATVDNSLGSCIPSKTTLDNTLLNFNNSITDIITNSQINYTLIGIVAEENNKCPSRYGVREHVDGNIILVIVNTKTGSKQYITKNLGPKKDEGGQPGVNLIDYINNNYPDLEILVTGRKLIADTGKIRNEIVEPGTDIEEVIEKYATKSEKTETTDDSEVTEYDLETEDEDYAISDQNLEDESDPDAELVAAECESESSESTE